MSQGFGTPPQTAQSGSGAILAWATGTAYAQGQTVTNSGHTYTANDAHTAGATFAGDLASHWTLLPVAKADVGLSNVDNTSDVNKPVSTAQATADALKLAKASNLSDLANAGTSRTNLGLGTAAVTALDVDGTLAANSDVKVPSQKAVKTYVEAQSEARRLTRMFVFGDSYASGFGAPSTDQGYAPRVARALGAELENFGYAGAILSKDNNTPAEGGYVNVLLHLLPLVRVAAPWEPCWQLVHFQYGLNDAALLNSGVPTTGTKRAYREALRSIINRARASGFYDDDHAIFTYGGWGTVFTATTYSSGGTMRQGATGDTITMVTPALGAGGEVVMYFIARETDVGTISFTVDGVSAGTLDITALSAYTGHYNIASKRLTGLSAGAHTIVATMATGSAWFDGASIQAVDDAPLVVLNNIPRTASDWASVAAVTAYNAEQTTVVAEYLDGRVVIADIDTALNKVSANFYDGLHPNDHGHALVAKAVYNAIRAATYPAPSANLNG